MRIRDFASTLNHYFAENERHLLKPVSTKEEWLDNFLWAANQAKTYSNQKRHRELEEYSRTISNDTEPYLSFSQEDLGVFLQKREHAIEELSSLLLIEKLLTTPPADITDSAEREKVRAAQKKFLARDTPQIYSSFIPSLQCKDNRMVSSLLARVKE